MGGYNPYPPPDETPRTAAEADAQNYIGQRNRQAAGLSGYGGRSQDEIDFINRQTQLRQEEQQSRRIPDNQGGYIGGKTPTDGSPTPEELAGQSKKVGFSGATISDQKGNFINEYRVNPENREVVGLNETTTSRPRYIPNNIFGDAETQNRVKNRTGEDQFNEIGRVLERQRQAARNTPSIKDDMFYQNQLDLWNAQSIERSAGYHAYGKKSGQQISANPFENEGDIALAIEKAGNKKDNFGQNYAFNPNVSNVMQVLPQKRDANGNLSPVGLQEYGWMGALSRDRGGKDVGAANFMPAIDYLNSQRGRQGVYGDLFGGVKDTFTPLPSGFANGGIIGEVARAKVNQKNAYTESNLPAPFISKIAEDPFAGSKPATVYRPSDQALWVNNNLMGGSGLIGGRAKAAGSALSGISDFFFPGTFTDTRVGKTQDTTRDQYDKMFGSGQPMATFKYINPDTNKATDKMNFDIGEPYVASDGKTYQDYQTSDLSKVSYTPVKVETRQGQSGFERGEMNFADKITKRIMPDIRLPRTGTPADYNIEFVQNAYAGVREKPLTATINAGVGLGLTALTVGVINPAVSGFAASTAATGSRLALPAAALKFGVTKFAPAALTSYYAYEFSSTATKGFTDLSPAASGRAGKRFGYETAPMIMGGLAFLPAAALTPKAIASTKGFVNRQLYSSPSGPDFTIPQPVRTRGQSLEITGGKTSDFSPSYISKTPQRSLELMDPRSGMRNDAAQMAWGGTKRRVPGSPPADQEWGMVNGKYVPWKPKKWITEYPKPKPVETKVATASNMRTMVEEKPLQLVATARRYPGASTVLIPRIPTSLKTEYGKVITGFQKRTSTGQGTRSLSTATQPPGKSGIGTIVLPPNYLNTGRGNDFSPTGFASSRIAPPSSSTSLLTQSGKGSGSILVAQPIPPVRYGTRSNPPNPPRITPGYTPVITPIIPPFSFNPGGGSTGYGGQRRKKPFLELFNTRRGSLQQAFKMKRMRLW